LRWNRHYLGRRQRWQDRALFRSLNMAVQAAQLPAGVGTTIYDLGRIASLWVSAFEILAHPRTDKSGLRYVYPLFDRVCYFNREIGRRRYTAYMNQKKPWPHRSFSCWLYGELYQARNDFLHGNPITVKSLYPKGSKVSLFWAAPALYRLALTGLLELSVAGKYPKVGSAPAIAEYANTRMLFMEPQSIIERALLKMRQ